MEEKFSSSPLVEIIAEVRWNTGQKIKTPVFHGEDSEKYEFFFNTLKDNLHDKGYLATERLVPLGYPMLVQNPIIRFKKSSSHGGAGDAKEQASLYQVGVGIFTINSVQPYSSWDEFKEVVSSGIECLINSKPTKDSGGYNLSLKYLDLFDDKYKGGMTNREFMSEVLGFKFDVPDVLSEFSDPGNIIIPRSQVVIPLDFGVYQMTLAEAEVNNIKGLLLENNVQINADFDDDLEQIMDGFIKARDVIHKTFIEITKPIHEYMNPIKE